MKKLDTGNLELLKSELRAAYQVEFKGNAFKCPAHDDNNASAAVYRDASGHCRAHCMKSGCDWNQSFDIIDLYKKLGRHTNPTPQKPLRKPQEAAQAVLTFEQVKSIYIKKLPLKSVLELFTDFADKAGKIITRELRFKTPTGKEIRYCSPLGAGWQCKEGGKPRPIANLKAVQDANSVILVEGCKKMQELNDLGLVATTTAGGACRLHDADLTDLAGKTVFCWADNDTAGKLYISDAIDTMLSLTPPAKVFKIDPERLGLKEKEDASDFILQLRNAGLTDTQIKAEIEDILLTSEPISPSRALKSFIDDVANGQLTPIELPFRTLDRLARPLLPKTICLLSGTPGSGKTFFLIQTFLDWLIQGVNFAAFALEEPLEHHLHRALALLSGESAILDYNWMQLNADYTKEIYRNNAEILDALSSRITDIPKAQISYAGLLDWAKSKINSGAKVLVLDPITAVEQSDAPWIEDTRFLMSLRAMLVENNVCALITTHPKKGMTAPQLDDLAGSASWQRFSQAVLWIEHLKEKKAEVCETSCGQAEITLSRIIHICKGRNAPGVGGKIGYTFGGSDLRFAEQGLIVNQRNKAKSKGGD